MNKRVASVSFVLNDLESPPPLIHPFLIESIYGNVLNISQNTRQAADELTVANQHQKKARKNMCCLLLIITIVGCVLALIIVVAK
jgi:t-SNARE complex subunit (syntaxin)